MKGERRRRRSSCLSTLFAIACRRLTTLAWLRILRLRFAAELGVVRLLGGGRTSRLFGGCKPRGSPEAHVVLPMDVVVQDEVAETLLMR